MLLFQPVGYIYSWVGLVFALLLLPLYPLVTVCVYPWGVMSLPTALSLGLCALVLVNSVLWVHAVRSWSLRTHSLLEITLVSRFFGQNKCFSSQIMISDQSALKLCSGLHL